jgi:hypothetical protein
MKKILFVLIASLCMQGLLAQDRSIFVISYPIAFPAGDLSDYISNTSFRGINLEFGKEVKPNLIVEIETGWNVFYQEQPDQVYTEGTASISGKQFRYTNSVPILAGAKWILKSKNNLVPYAGLGLGTMYSDRSTDFGLYRISTDAWQFCLRPELGITFKSRGGPSAMLGVKYYSSFNSSELDGQSFFTVNIGVVFPYGL